MVCTAGVLICNNVRDVVVVVVFIEYELVLLLLLLLLLLMMVMLLFVDECAKANLTVLLLLLLLLLYVISVLFLLFCVLSAFTRLLVSLVVANLVYSWRRLSFRSSLMSLSFSLLLFSGSFSFVIVLFYLAERENEERYRTSERKSERDRQTIQDDEIRRTSCCCCCCCCYFCFSFVHSIVRSCFNHGNNIELSIMCCSYCSVVTSCCLLYQL